MLAVLYSQGTYIVGHGYLLPINWSNIGKYTYLGGNMSEANNISIKPGDILLAEPFMSDMNFERSVILICEHTEESSFGFIMNCASDHMLGTVIEDLRGLHIPLYIG